MPNRCLKLVLAEVFQLFSQLQTLSPSEITSISSMGQKLPCDYLARHMSNSLRAHFGSGYQALSQTIKVPVCVLVAIA